MSWLVGMIALVAVVLVVRGQFNAEARARRRRERSHRPVTSRKQGPSVRLAVRAGKPKQEGKR